jgi:hypothetical protein
VVTWKWVTPFSFHDYHQLPPLPPITTVTTNYHRYHQLPPFPPITTIAIYRGARPIAKAVVGEIVRQLIIVDSPVPPTQPVPNGKC